MKNLKFEINKKQLKLIMCQIIIVVDECGKVGELLRLQLHGLSHLSSPRLSEVIFHDFHEKNESARFLR